MNDKKIVGGVVAVVIIIVMAFNLFSTGLSFSGTDRGFDIKAEGSYSAGECAVKGTISNKNSNSYHTVQVRVLFFNDDGDVIGSKGFFINDVKYNEKRKFDNTVEVSEKPSRMEVEIFGLL